MCILILYIILLYCQVPCHCLICLIPARSDKVLHSLGDGGSFSVGGFSLGFQAKLIPLGYYQSSSISSFGGSLIL